MDLTFEPEPECQEDISHNCYFDTIIRLEGEYEKGTTNLRQFGENLKQLEGEDTLFLLYQSLIHIHESEELAMNGEYVTVKTEIEISNLHTAFDSYDKLMERFDDIWRVWIQNQINTVDNLDEHGNRIDGFFLKIVEKNKKIKENFNPCEVSSP